MATDDDTLKLNTVANLNDDKFSGTNHQTCATTSFISDSLVITHTVVTPTKSQNSHHTPVKKPHHDITVQDLCRDERFSELVERDLNKSGHDDTHVQCLNGDSPREKRISRNENNRLNEHDIISLYEVDVTSNTMEPSLTSNYRQSNQIRKECYIEKVMSSDFREKLDSTITHWSSATDILQFPKENEAISFNMNPKRLKRLAWIGGMFVAPVVIFSIVGAVLLWWVVH